MSCCTSIADLGCVNFCDTVSTGVIAPATRTYVIEDTTRGAHFELAGTAGVQLTFINVFNEDSITVFKILDGAAYISNSSGNDCFQVAIKSGGDLTGEGGCEEVTVVNSDASYSVTVECGATLTLPDTTYNIYIGGNLTQSFTVATLKDETINIYP